MLSNVLAKLLIAAIMFKACPTAAATYADGRMPSREPNATACQKVLKNPASHISGNFSVKGQYCRDLR